MNIYVDDKEIEDLVDNCRHHQGDESYRLHLADYILEKVLSQLGLSLEGE